jgi:hypothetical protein
VLAFDMDPYRGAIHCQHCQEHLAVAAHIQEGIVRGAKAMTAADARALFGREPDNLPPAIVDEEGTHPYRADWDEVSFSEYRDD